MRSVVGKRIAKRDGSTPIVCCELDALMMELSRTTPVKKRRLGGFGSSPRASALLRASCSAFEWGRYPSVHTWHSRSFRVTCLLGSVLSGDNCPDGEMW